MNDPWFLKPPSRLGVVILILVLFSGTYLHNKVAETKVYHDELKPVTEFHKQFDARFEERIGSVAFRSTLIDIIKSVIVTLWIAGFIAVVSTYPIYICLCVVGTITFISYIVCINVRTSERITSK